MGFRHRNPFEMNMGVPLARNKVPESLDENERVRRARPINTQESRDEDISKQNDPVLVELPRHLFIPEDTVSLDFRRVCGVTAGSSRDLFIEWTAPPGCVTRFISYGVFSDAELALDTEFIPTVDGSRVFPYHGDPQDAFRIRLGLAPDLSNNSLIQCNLSLQPGQVLRWFVTNTSTVEQKMGVRMVGYYDAKNQTRATRFGS